MSTHGPIYKMVDEELAKTRFKAYEAHEIDAMFFEIMKKIQELEAQSKSYQIKPLEWTKVMIDYPGYKGPKDAYYWIAPGYMINLPNSRGWVICGVPLEKGESNIYFKTEDEAKSICEKNYEETVKLNLI